MSDEPGRDVSYEILLEAGACIDYRQKFVKLYGWDGVVPLTVTLAESVADEWDWRWAAEYMLSDDGYAAWQDRTAEANRIYGATMGPVWDATADARDEAEQAALKAYAEHDPETGSAWHAYYAARRAIMDPAYDRERQAEKEADHALHVVQARVFAELWIQEGANKDE